MPGDEPLDSSNPTTPTNGAGTGIEALPTADIGEHAQVLGGGASSAPQAQTGVEEAAPEAAKPIDKWGRKFDPELHATTRDGGPALSRSGGLMKKPGTPDPDLPLVKGSRRAAAPRAAAAGPAPAASPTGSITISVTTPESDAAAGDGTEPVAEAPAMSDADRVANARTQANLSVRIWTMAGRMFGGTGSAPDKDEKEDLYVTAYNHYFETGGKLPFGWLLLHFFVGIGYMMRIVGGIKKFFEAIGTAWDKTVNLFTGRKAKPPAEAPQQPAPAPAPAAEPEQPGIETIR